MTLILETERLSLREWEAGDAEALFAFTSDAETMRFIGDTRPWETVERARAWLVRVGASYAERGYGPWAVVERATGRVVGSCGFSLLPTLGELDFGYVFARDSWGRGYATEAAAAALSYGFERLGFEEVTANTVAEHHASRHVLEKIGFEYRGPRRYPDDDEPSAFYVATNPATRRDARPAEPSS
ncbi:MAG TPA: GNAT family N-acetyltransferase [Pyrinomonadaceae bacterium]|nr:GNAT family N-acetyltransferase [Pyrinomonadaceae bacterium]